MQFVHITDLHFKTDDAFQRELIRQLLIDLEAAHGKAPNPDFLVFSGDLVKNPDDEDSFPTFEREFLIPVLSALQLPASKVVLCPGNHDISWAVLKDRGLAYDTLQSKLKDPAYITDQGRKNELRAFARDIGAGFFELAARYGGSWDNPFSKVYSFDTEKVSFVALNSAFGCSLKGSEADRGHLAVSAELALASFQNVPSGHKIISLVHHTFGDMTEGTTRLLVPIIEKYADAHCFGHVHQPKPTAPRSVSGSCFNVQGGALYEKDGHYNGYAIVRLAEAHGHFEAKYRSYYVDRNEFDVGTNVSSEGLFYSSQAAKNYYVNLVPTPAQDDVCLWLLQTQEAVSSSLDETITERSLRETFVEPLIVRPSQGKEENAEKLEEQFPLSKLMSITDDIVIGGDKEYGSTSLVRYLTMQFHEKCRELPKALVPALLDARKLRPYENSITGSLRSAIPESDARSLKLPSIHDCGRLVVLIDNFDPAEPSQLTILGLLRTHYPKARLIVAAKLPLLWADHLMPVVGIEDFIFVQIRPLNRGRIRTLIQKIHEPSGCTVDQAVEEITSRFRALGIPLIASYVVIYLFILKEDKGFSPINFSTVIESFVERVLEKYKPEYRFRSAFDYRNQIDYLASMAEQMCRQNKFVVAYDELYAWTKEYFESIGIDHDYTKLIEYFNRNKVFDVSANSVSFSYNIFISFFVAHQMQQSSEFRDWILSSPNYMSYINEIDIYCGLNRRDSAALEFLGSEFKRLSDELAKLAAPLAWVEPLENLKLAPDKEDFADNITRQLTQPNLPAEKRDAMLGAGEQPEDVKPKIKRAEVQGLVGSWVMSLRAYTVALKNLEGIPRESKEAHLQAVLEGWATMLRYACLFFKDLLCEAEARHRTCEIQVVFAQQRQIKAPSNYFSQYPAYYFASAEKGPWVTEAISTAQEG